MEILETGRLERTKALESSDQMQVVRLFMK
jgi:hypothetical protein